MAKVNGLSKKEKESKNNKESKNINVNLVKDLDLDLEWNNFCEDSMDLDLENTNNNNSDLSLSLSMSMLSLSCKNPTEENVDTISINKVKCSKLYISTKTKICYLNKPVDLKKVFWEIPVVPYHVPQVGVVKKQMKFNTTSPEDLSFILSKLTTYDYVDNYIISQIINPDGRIKFKDIRKISIGLSKKDITSYRCKKKSAFYNCFVVILRLLQNDKFKEINVKVFNTGQLEIPGIQDDATLETVLKLLIHILGPIVDTDGSVPLNYLKESSSTVLINSNFNCGYYINRENLYNILKYKYKISSNYDPCSYPGIQCSFYYDMKLAEQTGMMPLGFICNKKMKKIKDSTLNIGITSVSVMIFRTGSMLIVGKCTETILYDIYNFLCNMFETEYASIADKQGTLSATQTANNKKNAGLKIPRKIRKKSIYCSSE